MEALRPPASHLRKAVIILLAVCVFTTFRLFCAWLFWRGWGGGGWEQG